MFLRNHCFDSDLRSQSINPVQMARIAFVIAFVSTVDAFRPVSLGYLAPALRTSNDVALKSNLGLRRHSLKSTNVLGLRATATSPLTDSLEKAYNDPSAPHCRERMYEIAQASSVCTLEVLSYFELEI